MCLIRRLCLQGVFRRPLCLSSPLEVKNMLTFEHFWKCTSEMYPSFQISKDATGFGLIAHRQVEAKLGWAWLVKRSHRCERWITIWSIIGCIWTLTRRLLLRAKRTGEIWCQGAQECWQIDSLCAVFSNSAELQQQQQQQERYDWVGRLLWERFIRQHCRLSRLDYRAANHACQRTADVLGVLLWYDECYVIGDRPERLHLFDIDECSLCFHWLLFTVTFRLHRRLKPTHLQFIILPLTFSLIHLTNYSSSDSALLTLCAS